MKYEKIEDWSEVWSEVKKARVEWSQEGKNEVKKWRQVKSSQEVKKWRMNEKGKNE